MRRFIILVIAGIASIGYAQSSNLDYSKQYLNNEISLELYLSKIDTSKSALLKFITESEKANTNFETQISNGPVEFELITDSLLSEFGKSSDRKILQILSSIDSAVDGYISESFSAYVASYIEKFPDTYQKAIIEQGKDSWILMRFLFGKGTDYADSKIIKNNMPEDSLIVEWIDYQIQEYFK